MCALVLSDKCAAVAPSFPLLSHAKLKGMVGQNTATEHVDTYSLWVRGRFWLQTNIHNNIGLVAIAITTLEGARLAYACPTNSGALKDWYAAAGPSCYGQVMPHCLHCGLLYAK